ncbi:unnamed protein product [Penicillium salamii]|nr:unnamed protein product [Penicillium salamii]CAG8273264.1 unnamed protein product [Penicillium salamii]CAG8293081.1 unnamed protein product [Penicillium salamii]
MSEAETKRDVKKWLMGRHSPNELFADFTEKRLDGTCEWILTKGSFVDWSSSDFPAAAAKLLWINGPPGFGKSTLCARLIKHLTDTIKEPIAHFFFSSDFETRADPFVAIRSWISQISHHPTAFKLIRERWATQCNQTATRADIIELLQAISQAIHGCTFALDGLDECTWSRGGDDSVTVFLETIKKATKGTATRILVVSRSEPDIRHGIISPSPGTTVFQHKISLEDVSSDIQLYSMSIVETRLPRKTEATKLHISQKMASGCNGQFLWLKLQQDSLRSWKNQKQLEDTIDKTPAGLELLYERNWRMMSRFPKRERARVFALLRWTAFAFRPLTVRELTEALLIDEKKNELLLDEMPDTIDEDYIDSEIVSLCGSLLEVRTSQSELHVGLRTVHLAHFSVKEYILCNMPFNLTIPTFKPLSESVESIYFAKRCLCYLNIPEVWSNGSTLRDDQVHGSFLDYAAGHWYKYYAVDELNDSRAVGHMNAFFDSSNPAWHSWRRWMEHNDKVLAMMNVGSRSILRSPLFYAVLVHLPDTVRYLNEKKGFQPNEHVSLGWTVLTVACYRGDLETTQALLDAGANVNTVDDDGWTPLHFASAGGHTDLAKLLLTAGADTSPSAKTGLTYNNGHHDTLHPSLHWKRCSYPCVTLPIVPYISLARAQLSPQERVEFTFKMLPQRCDSNHSLRLWVQVRIRLLKLRSLKSETSSKKMEQCRFTTSEISHEAHAESDPDSDSNLSHTSRSGADLAPSILWTEDATDWSFSFNLKWALGRLSEWMNGIKADTLWHNLLTDPSHLLDLVAMYVMYSYKSIWRASHLQKSLICKIFNSDLK